VSTDGPGDDGELDNSDPVADLERAELYERRPQPLLGLAREQLVDGLLEPRLLVCQLQVDDVTPAGGRGRGCR